MRWRVFAGLLGLLLLISGKASAAQIGVWQFDNNLDNAVAGGTALSAFGGWTPTYSAATIGGNPATALSFPALTNAQSLQMTNQAPPSGGALTNAWSIVMDVNFPTIGGFIGLWQTDQNIAGSDGDFFIRGDGALGISGNYHGVVPADTWTRIAVTIQPVGTDFQLDKYVNGVLAGTTTTGGAPDGRHAVGQFLNLFTDEDGETAAGLVNSLAYYNHVLSAAEIAALGGATAGGVAVIPEPTALALAAGSLAGLLMAHRRRR